MLPSPAPARTWIDAVLLGLLQLKFTTFGFLNGEFGHVESHTRGSYNRVAFFTVLVDSPNKEFGYPDSLECSPSVFSVVEQVPTPVTAPVKTSSFAPSSAAVVRPSLSPPPSAACSASLPLVPSVPSPVLPARRRSRHAKRRSRKAPSSASLASAVRLCPQEVEGGGARPA